MTLASSIQTAGLIGAASISASITLACFRWLLILVGVHEGGLMIQFMLYIVYVLLCIGCGGLGLYFIVPEGWKGELE